MQALARRSRVAVWICCLICLAFHAQRASADPLDPGQRAAVLQSGRVGAAVVEALESEERVRVMIVFSVAGLEGGRGVREFASPESQSRIATAADRVLGRFAPGEFDLRRRYTSINALAGYLGAPGLQRLAADPDTVRVDVDAGGSGHLAQAVPLVGLDVLHTSGLTGQGVQIAVLDSGADNAHADTGDAVIAESCFCSDSGAGCCPSGGTTEFGPGAAQDDHGHGTNVTGVITSDGDVAPVGGAPGSDIVSIKVLDSNNSFCCSSDVVAGLDWIINNRPDVDVVNMSLGTFALFSGDCDNATAFTMAFATAIDTLRSNGVLSVVSSGNEGSGTQMGAPACVANSLAVGAVWDSNVGPRTILGCTDTTTAADKVTCFTSSNASTDLFAPGAPMTSAGLGGGTSTFYGTSQAAPTVAACAAVLLEDRPSLTPDQLEVELEDSPVQVTDVTNGLSFPRLDCKVPMIQPPGPKMYQGRISVHRYAPTYSAPSVSYHALPLGAQCNSVVGSATAPCNATPTLHAGAPLSGSGILTAFYSTGSSAFAPSSAGVRFGTGNIGEIRRTAGGSLPYRPLYPLKRTTASVYNGPGSFFPGGGPGSFGYVAAGGPSQGGYVKVTAGARQFGGTLRLLGRMGSFVQRATPGPLSIGSYDWQWSVIGASCGAGGCPLSPYQQTYTALFYNTLGYPVTSLIRAGGFPWTTGRVSVSAPYAPIPTLLVRTGFDNRTSGGKGTIRLVSPQLTHFLLPAAPRSTAAIAILTLELAPEPSSCVMLAVGSGLLGALYRRRRRVGNPTEL